MKSIHNNFVKTLKLSKNDWKVFEGLSYENTDLFKSTADLSKQLNIPRMSTHIALKSLKERGLIDYKRVGKRKLWYRITPENLIKKFANISQEIDKHSQVTIGVSDSEFTIYNGVDSLYKVWEALLELPANTRVQGFQPTASIRESLQKLEWSEKIQHLQENIRSKPIIIEGLLSEDYYPFLVDFYKNDKSLLLKTLESFLGRATDMTFIKKDFLNLATEMFILPDSAYITNWKEEVSICIKNKTIINFLRELFSLAKGYGKHIDQNKYIGELIEKVKLS